MAKKGGSEAKVETPTVNEDATNSTTPGEPVFSADALSKLTQRIQIGFDGAKNKVKGHKVSGGKDKGKGEKDDPKKSAKKSQEPAKSENFKKQEFNPASVANAIATGGKKRARDSKGDSNPKKNTPSKPKSSSANGTPKTKDGLPKKAGKKAGIDKEALLKEIVELGGTQEDLDLVEGVDSNSDEEETVIPESGKDVKDVKKALENFMKEIGLDARKSVEADGGEDEQDEEWQDEGMEEGGENDDEDENEDEDEDEDDEDEDENEDVEMKDASAKQTTANAAPVAESKAKGKLLFVPRPDWHAEELPPITHPSYLPSPAQVQTLHAHAKTLLQSENALYSATHLTKSSDRQFLSTIMTSGTLSDKISALTLICQESPLHTTKTLETLLSLARKKSRSQAIAALAAIKDLFASGVVLPPNRKLKFFAKQPGLGGEDCKDIHLLVWAYEDWLKNFYFEILKTLEEICADQLVYARSHAVGYVFELLKEKPEQESNLLRLLVNKIGDTDKKVASKVSFLLLQLQSTHPAMKSIIVNAIESEVVFRPGNSLHAKYYAIITLNQTILSSREIDVANKLLNLYFSVFTSLLQKSPAAATTVSTTKGTHTKFADDEKTPAQGGKMNKKARARAEKEEKGKQFEEEINAKLISAVLAGVNRAFPFSKIDDEVFQKHVDTLFRITHSGNFNTSIQALILIFQVANSKQMVSDRFYRTLYESLLDQRLVTSSKQAMYLNLLFKALKADTHMKRVKAFVKRIIQIATMHQPPFICGVIYLLSELESSLPGLRSLLEIPEETEDDEEEVFKDVPEEGEEGEKKEEKKEGGNRPQYDGRKRDPLHAEADKSCLWEFLPFLSHFHPTVALFASHFLQNKPMPSKPDLGMHTLTHFLDRFVYRNAKSASGTSRGQSIMQPLSGAHSHGLVLSTRGTTKTQAPVNSESFWKRKVEDVAADEVFFHKYFNQTAPKKTKAEKRDKKKDAGSDEEEEENEEEIWKALVDSKPELEMDNGEVDFDDDEDLDLEDDEDDDLSDEEAVDGKIDEDSDEDGGVNFDDDKDDVWNTDEDMPEDLEKAFEKEFEKATKKKGQQLEAPEDEGESKKKKRKLKHLPTFASVEDYADMLSD
ncbi:RNA-binding ribosome biosynthesis protein mak21 [Rhizina undulata]